MNPVWLLLATEVMYLKVRFEYKWIEMMRLIGPSGLFTELNYPGKGAYTIILQQTNIPFGWLILLASFPVALRRLNSYVSNRTSEDREMVIAACCKRNPLCRTSINISSRKPKHQETNTRLFWIQLTQTSDLYLLTLSLGYEILLSFFLLIIII